MPAATCSTLNVAPAMVNVPVRSVPVLADTWKVALPVPVPDVEPVIVTHDRAFVSDHGQPDWVVTVIVPVPPVVGNDWSVGLSEYRQGPLMPSWVKVKNCPAMLSVPVRAASIPGDTWKPTVPVPEPEADVVRVTQVREFVTDHAQVLCVVTVMFPEPPAKGND